MTKILSVLFSIAFFTSSALALDLAFVWTLNPSNEMVTSYIIQKATLPSPNFVNVVTCAGTTNYGIVKGLGNGSYKFRLVAINGVGQSPPSNELSYPTNTPGSPINFNYAPPK